MTNTTPIRERLPDGSTVVIRAIQPSDVELERQFIEALSPESRRYRFLCGMQTPSDALLKQLTEIDEARDAALIAITGDGEPQRMVGVARFSLGADSRAEVAVTVSDDWRMRGLGTVLMRYLIRLAQRRGITTLYSTDPADNEAMHRFARSIGFSRKTNPDDLSQVIHTLSLRPLPA